MTPKEQIDLINKIRYFTIDVENNSDCAFDDLDVKEIWYKFERKFGQNTFNETGRKTRKTEREVDRLFNAMNKRLMMFA